MWCRAVADQKVRQGDYKPRLPNITIKKLEGKFSEIGFGEVTKEELSRLGLTDYYFRLRRIAKKRRPITVNHDGVFGFGPSETQLGDSVYRLLRASTPYILRSEPNGSFRLIGECYILEITYREVMERQLPIMRIRL